MDIIGNKRADGPMTRLQENANKIERKKQNIYNTNNTNTVITETNSNYLDKDKDKSNNALKTLTMYKSVVQQRNNQSRQQMLSSSETYLQVHDELPTFCQENQTENQQTLEKLNNEKQFDDRLHQFVQTMKDLTQVQEVNIFSQELVQIYNDMQSQKEINCTEDQRKSIEKKLKDFNMMKD